MDGLLGILSCYHTGRSFPPQFCLAFPIPLVFPGPFSFPADYLLSLVFAGRGIGEEERKGVVHSLAVPIFLLLNGSIAHLSFNCAF